MSQWFIKSGDRLVGPIEPARLKKLAIDGKITPQTLVRSGDNGDFVPARRIKNLFPSETTAIPPVEEAYGVAGADVQSASTPFPAEAECNWQIKSQSAAVSVPGLAAFGKPKNVEFKIEQHPSLNGNTCWLLKWKVPGILSRLEQATVSGRSRLEVVNEGFSGVGNLKVQIPQSRYLASGFRIRLVNTDNMQSAVLPGMGDPAALEACARVMSVGLGIPFYDLGAQLQSFATTDTLQTKPDGPLYSIKETHRQRFFVAEAAGKTGSPIRVDLRQHTIGELTELRTGLTKLYSIMLRSSGMNSENADRRMEALNRSVTLEFDRDMAEAFAVAEFLTAAGNVTMQRTS